MEGMGSVSNPISPEKQALQDAIRDMRESGIPVRYIAGTLGISRAEVEGALSEKSYGEGLSAQIESKIDILLKAVDEEKVSGARLSEITGSIKVLNEVKRLEEGKSTENIDMHVHVREALRAQVKRHRESVSQKNETIVEEAKGGDDASST